MKEGSVEEFVQIIKESDNIVFFGGAGVSTESGIPDFRSVDGLYNMKYDYHGEKIILPPSAKAMLRFPVRQYPQDHSLIPC